VHPTCGEELDFSYPANGHQIAPKVSSLANGEAVHGFVHSNVEASGTFGMCRIGVWILDSRCYPQKQLGSCVNGYRIT